jgi:crotonobetainyl-CoA:carnitine CoA-transferase CaiB-like acyl-CoA transferase
VVEVAQGIAGPFFAMVLGDLGADVIKVEIPRVGDLARGWGPPFSSPRNYAYFLSVNRNKRSLELDLKSPGGAEVLRRLLVDADILVENFRPGTLEDLGFGPAVLESINPRLLRVSITGYGPGGPSRNDPSFDLIAQARSGLMSVTGTPDGQPIRVGIALFDLAAGLYAAIGVLTQLREREAGRPFRPVQVNLLDTSVSMLTHWLPILSLEGRVPGPSGTAHPLIVPYQVLPTQDGFVALGVSTDILWHRFCQALGLGEMEKDPRFVTNAARVAHRQEVLDRILPVLRSWTTRRAVEELNRAGVPCGPLSRIEDLPQDPQIQFNHSILTVMAPGGRSVLVGGSPLASLLPEGGPVARRPPPDLGEHTEEILGELDRKASDGPGAREGKA